MLFRFFASPSFTVVVGHAEGARRAAATEGRGNRRGICKDRGADVREGGGYYQPLQRSTGRIHETKLHICLIQMSNDGPDPIQARQLTYSSHSQRRPTPSRSTGDVGAAR